MKKIFTGTKKLMWAIYALIIWGLIIYAIVYVWNSGKMETLVDNCMINSISTEVPLGQGLKSVYKGEWQFDEKTIKGMQKAGSSRAIWTGAVGMIENGDATTQKIAVTFMVSYDDLLEQTYIELTEIRFATYVWDPSMNTDTGINIMRVLMGIDGYTDIYNGIDENWNIQTITLTTPANLKNMLAEQYEVEQAGGSESTFFGGEDDTSANQSSDPIIYDVYTKYYDDGTSTLLVFTQQENGNYAITLENYDERMDFIADISGATTSVYSTEWTLEYSNGPVEAVFRIRAVEDGVMEVVMTSGIDDLSYLDGLYYAG